MFIYIINYYNYTIYIIESLIFLQGQPCLYQNVHLFSRMSFLALLLDWLLWVTRYWWQVILLCYLIPILAYLVKFDFLILIERYLLQWEYPEVELFQLVQYNLQVLLSLKDPSISYQSILLLRPCSFRVLRVIRMLLQILHIHLIVSHISSRGQIEGICIAFCSKLDKSRLGFYQSTLSTLYPSLSTDRRCNGPIRTCDQVREFQF